MTLLSITHGNTGMFDRERQKTHDHNSKHTKEIKINISLSAKQIYLSQYFKDYYYGDNNIDT